MKVIDKLIICTSWIFLDRWSRVYPEQTFLKDANAPRRRAMFRLLIPWSRRCPWLLRRIESLLFVIFAITAWNQRTEAGTVPPKWSSSWRVWNFTLRPPTKVTSLGQMVFAGSVRCNVQVHGRGTWVEMTQSAVRNGQMKTQTSPTDEECQLNRWYTNAYGS